MYNTHTTYTHSSIVAVPLVFQYKETTEGVSQEMGMVAIPSTRLTKPLEDFRAQVGNSEGKYPELAGQSHYHKRSDKAVKKLIIWNTKNFSENKKLNFSKI